VKLFAALAIGAATGVAAVFLHLFLPPFGLVLACLGSFTAIWAIGRKYGKRRYKFLAAFSWFYIFARASSFGTGKEIFIQGDSLGNNFLFFGFIALALAIALPAN
jgi:hypothetical protein